MALIGVLVFLTLFLFIFGMSRRFTETRRRVVQRIETFDPIAARPKEPKRRERSDRPDGSRRKQLRVSFMTNVESALVRGEFQISPREFLVRWVLVTLIIAVLGYLFKGPIVALLVVVLSIVVTLTYMRSRGTRRLRRFEEGLHDMLTITANSLRSGYSFLQSVQVVTEDMHGPIQEEFARVLDEMNIGVPLDQALKSASVRIQSDDFQLIVTAILIQRQVGGNLAEVLDQIAVTIRARVQLKAEVKALTAQGRMSGMIFMLLPIGVGAFVYVTDPSYIGILFQSLIGVVMLIAAAVMQLIGYFIIRKIVDIQL